MPYEQRNAAKAAGALWDKAAKSWYAGPRADMAKLEQWKPENVQAQQGPAMTPREEFAEAMRSAGLSTQGDHPIMDGKRHRVPVEGGKKGARKTPAKKTTSGAKKKSAAKKKTATQAKD